MRVLSASVSAPLYCGIDAYGDLLHWSAVTNFFTTNVTMHLPDSSATNCSRRFYRAVVP